MLHHVIAVVLLLVRIPLAYLKVLFRLFVRPPVVSVAGKVALITGSGSGLGREIAVRLAEQGARLVLWDISENGNKGTAQQIRDTVPETELYLYTVDVTNKDVVKATALQVQREVGQVYMLFNNAGILVGETLLDLKDGEIERTVNVNLLSHFWTLRAFLPSMLESNSGHIVTTCSTGGQSGGHRLVDYCATKFGVLGLDESLESELRDVYMKNGIRQTLVCPHAMDTGLVHSFTQRFVQNMSDVRDAADSIVDQVLRQYRYAYYPNFYRCAATIKEILPHEGFLALRDFVNVTMSSQKSTNLIKD